LRRLAEQLKKSNNRDDPNWLRTQRLIFAEMELWLDRAEWNPHFRDRDVAEMVADAIHHRHERRDWHMHEYVIMPTHIHLFCEIGPRGMKAVLEDFKRWTAHRAADLLQVGPACRAGPDHAQRSRSASGTYRFWQREWFDHWSRSDAEDDRTITYIRNNPLKAGLATNYHDWPYASRSRLPGGT
jgi:REP element-mobilizing transposase RayT